MPFIFLLPFVLAAIMAAIWLVYGTEWRGRSRSHYGDPAGGTVLCTNRAPKPFTIIRVADAFEPETSILWETQMPALERISAAGRRGLAAETLRPIYAESAALYPELYEGTEFQTWVQFLEGAELIVWREEKATITTSGIEFLKCRVAATVAV